jgi:hypothetical protein
LNINLARRCDLEASRATLFLLAFFPRPKIEYQLQQLGWKEVLWEAWRTLS